MQSFSSRIWTRVAVSISYDDNHYTTDTSTSTPLLPPLHVHSGLEWLHLIGQIELNCVLVLNWIVWNRTVFHLNCVLMLNWIVWNGTVFTFNAVYFPVGWISRIHRLLLCRGVRHTPTSVLDMTLNNLMLRFQ